MFKLLMVLPLLLISPCLTHANELDLSFAIGIVTRDSSILLMSTTEESLRDDIILICSPVNKVCKSILGESFSAVKKNEFVEDVATSKNIHTYSLSDNTSSNDIEVAIIYPKASVGVVNVTFEGENHMLIIGSGLKYKVSFCTSNEGVHVYSAFKSVHLYYALGYEVMANCSEEIYK